MQCSKCGFMMTALDTECLRCKRQGTLGIAEADSAEAVLGGIEEKECPRCGKAAAAAAAVCDKCGYEYLAGGGSRAERYQARLAQEALASPPQAVGLRRSLPAAVSWGIIAACLLVVLGAGWAMFGRAATDSSAGSGADQPIRMARRRRPLVGLQNVTYSVTGTAAQALVTYSDAANAKPAKTKPLPVALPWTLTVKAKAGSHLSLSAAPAGGTGTVAASLKVNGIQRKQSFAPGTDGQVTVEDTL